MRLFGTFVFGIASLVLVGAFPANAADWPRFRGDELRGTARGPILQSWPKAGLSVLWRIPLQGGFSACAIADGRLFTLANLATVVSGTNSALREYCLCLDPLAGATNWLKKLVLGQYPARSTSGPYSTPTVKDGRVYVYSTLHVLWCLDATTGAELWHRDIIGDFNTKIYDFGCSQSPWVEDGRVFISAFAATNCIMAFNASDGAVLWRGHTNSLAYGSPVGATIDGVRQIIFPDESGCVAVAPETGRLLWTRVLDEPYSQSGGSPVVCGDTVIGLNATVSGAVGFRVLHNVTNGTFATSSLWTNSHVASTYATAVTDQGYAYFASGSLRCADLLSGKERWSTNIGAVSLILVNDQLVVQGPSGELILARASPLRYQPLAFQPPQKSDSLHNFLNSPAFWNGRLYLRNQLQLVCLDASAPPPPLQITANLLPSGQAMQLTVRCQDGSPIDYNRLPRIAICSSSDLSLPRSQWSMLPLPLFYTGGCFSAEAPLPPSGSSAFYSAAEQKP